MKNLKHCLLSLLFLPCLFLSTYSHPHNNMNADIEGDGITRIVITLPGGNAGNGRVVGNPKLMEFELTFQGPGGQTFTETASGGQTVTVQVVPGRWTVKVRSYDPATGVDEAKGEVISFEVKQGQTNKPILQMRFIDTAPIALYLASASGGGSASDPVSLHLNIPLTASDWSALLSTIDTAGKYVDLNLSACTDSGSASGAGISAIGSGRGYSPSITTISLPEGVTSIGNWAFDGCTSLATISLPASLTTIGEGAFFDCTNLALTSLPAGVTTIGDNAFFQCTGLTLSSLPASITTIGSNAFANCTSLTLSSLPAGVTTIGFGAFAGCTSLAILDLSNATLIEWSAFDNCTNLVSVTLGSGVSFGTPSGNLVPPFPGDLDTVYSGAGTYTRPNGSSLTWTKQP